MAARDLWLNFGRGRWAGQGHFWGNLRHNIYEF